MVVVVAAAGVFVVGMVGQAARRSLFPELTN